MRKIMAAASKQTSFVELVLTCGSWQEAQRIVDHLLEHKLIACAKFLPIQSKYWWEGELNEAKEVMLLMESTAHYFDKIEEEAAALHSYKTFVLKSMPLDRLSEAAATWLQGELKLTD
jgi:periplasmic divalent cation tolerance protein